MTLLTIDTPVDFDYDPFSEESLRDPTALQRELRARYPAYPLPQYDAWAFSRFKDVWAIGENRTHFVMDIGPLFDPALLARSNGGKAPELPSRWPNGLPSFSVLDPPIQVAVRQDMGAPFRPRQVAALEDYIRQLARARLDVLVPLGEFDLYTDYGGYVSAGVICHIVGLAPELAPTILETVNKSMQRKPPGRLGGYEDKMQAMQGFLVAAVAARRANPDGDPIPAIDGLLESTSYDAPLTDEEIANQLSTIVIGGTETVPKVAARCVLELHRRPEQLAEVRADLAANCGPAYEEAMRFGAPLQYVGRTATHDIEVAGAQIRAGQRVFLLIPSANRDEREFPDPDEFIWNRTIRRHFAFGHGPHFCIGAHVARLEGRIIVEELLRRAPSFTLDESRASMPPSDFQIGYVKLPIIIG